MTRSRSAVLASMLLSATLWFSQVRGQTPPASSLADAEQSFSARRYKEAALLAAAVAEHASTPQLHFAALLLQAKALTNTPDFPAAEQVLDQYIGARPRSAEALYLLGFVLQRENKPKDSLAIYTRAAALAPPQPNDLKLVALDYVLLNDYPDAIIWLKRSLEADAANAEAWYFLGRAHMQGGDFVEAEKDFRRSLALAPRDSKALDNLGLSLAAQNRTEEAARAYRDAIAGQSGAVPSEQPFLNLGTLLNDENHSSDALPLLRRAVEIAPGNVHCHQELARAYASLGKAAEAIRSMEHAVALDASNPSLHFRLGQLYRKAGMTEKAAAEIQLSSRLYGTHSTDQPR